MADEAFLNGGGEDGFEKPVGLDGSDPTDTGIAEIGPPAAYVGVSDDADGRESGSPLSANLC
jgi:hypothetical protein